MNRNRFAKGSAVLYRDQTVGGMTMEREFIDFCDRLQIKYREELLPLYEEGTKLYKVHGDFIVEKERLIAFNDKYNFFRRWFDDVLKAADLVREDRDLMLHAYILVALIKAKEDIFLLEMPDRKRMDTDFSPLFGLLYFLEEMIGDLERRGVPHDVISDTMHGFDSEITDYYDRNGRSGMRNFTWWFMLWVRGEILRVGRLQFQLKKLPDKIRVYKKGDDVKILIDGEYMHEKGMRFGSAGQDDEAGRFYADIVEEEGKVTGYKINEFGECEKEKITLVGYEEVVKCGDNIINVHIPSHDPFTPEICEESYKRAIEILKTCYPEYEYKAMTCISWLMEKRLRQIMGRDTNITRFADKYIVYPRDSFGTGVYSCLYQLPAAVDPKELPENSSMQRAVKEYLCAGNYFYEKGGLFLV